MARHLRSLDGMLVAGPFIHRRTMEDAGASSADEDAGCERSLRSQAHDVTRTLIYVTLAVVADGCAALVGGLLPERWLARNRGTLVGFASGVLLGTTFLDLLPEARAAASLETVVISVLASFAVMGAIEWAVGRRKHSTSGGRLAAMLLGADAFHNTTDGAVIAASFLISTRLGLITTVAVVAHEVPEELADYVLLRSARLSKVRALVAMTAIQLTAAVGAAVSLASAATWRSASGLILAIAGGTFLYIAVVDLLPSLLRSERGQPRAEIAAMVGLIAGLVLTVVEAAL